MGGMRKKKKRRKGTPKAAAHKKNSGYKSESSDHGDEEQMEVDHASSIPSKVLSGQTEPTAALNECPPLGDSTITGVPSTEVDKYGNLDQPPSSRTRAKSDSKSNLSKWREPRKITSDDDDDEGKSRFTSGSSGDEECEGQRKSTRLYQKSYVEKQGATSDMTSAFGGARPKDLRTDSRPVISSNPATGIGSSSTEVTLRRSFRIPQVSAAPSSDDALSPSRKRRSWTDSSIGHDTSKQVKFSDVDERGSVLTADNTREPQPANPDTEVELPGKYSKLPLKEHIPPEIWIKICGKHFFDGKNRRGNDSHFMPDIDKDYVKGMIGRTARYPDEIYLDRKISKQWYLRRKFKGAIGIGGTTKDHCHWLHVVSKKKSGYMVSAYPESTDKGIGEQIYPRS